MRSLCLAISRISLAAWVGAASLFVVTSVREVRASEIDSVTRSLLAAVRFPAYYAFGFALTSVAFLCGLMAYRHGSVGRLRMRIYLGLLLSALALMAADYFLIYRSLSEMVAQPAAARPAAFSNYHSASIWINSAGLAFCGVAAFLIAWPSPSSTPFRAVKQRT